MVTFVFTYLLVGDAHIHNQLPLLGPYAIVSYSDQTVSWEETTTMRTSRQMGPLVIEKYIPLSSSTSD